MTDFANEIVQVFGNSRVPLWLPDLASDLTGVEWARLARESGIDPESYGTVRVLRRRTDAPRIVAKWISTPMGAGVKHQAISIEILDTELKGEYGKSGITFYAEKDLNSCSAETVSACVQDALELIRVVPSLLKTVVTLVRSVHLIEPESDEYDVSFSEPRFPFSIFVSVPTTNSDLNAVRVAEAIVHEAMHLHLTLIERTVQLVSDETLSIYSPWKHEPRPANGVLHALYVFRAILSFFELAAKCPGIATDVRAYMENRQSEISRQVFEVRLDALASQLSPIGRRLLERLVASKRFSF